MCLTNLHSHTTFSDGKNTPEEMVRMAIEKNIKVLGFSDHSPVPFYSFWNMKNELLNEYILEIKMLKEKYRDYIQIYLGMEMDYIEKYTDFNAPILKNMDYKIGSIHYLKKYSDGKIFNYDISKAEFCYGLKNIFDDNIRNLVKYYFYQISEMILSEKPNFVGHFDLIAKFNKYKFFFDDSERWYINTVNEALDVVKQTDTILEVNTRGYYKQLTLNFYPSYEILKRCRRMKIPIIVNADSHCTEELDKSLKSAYSLLQEIGYQELRVLYDNKWQNICFDRHGLKL